MRSTEREFPQAKGAAVFRYAASVRAFVGSDDEPLDGHHQAGLDLMR